MIIRKPYALLIKYFRLIHLVLSLIMCLFLLKYIGVIKFFQSYISNNYTTSIRSGLSSTYTPFYLFIFLILIMAIVVTILILFLHKNKPTKFYIIQLIYYIVFFIFLIVVSSTLSSFEDELLDAATARAMRDLVIILPLPQLYFIFICFMRTVGFDLKKFDFSSDLRDMNLTRSDDEEVEVNLSFDNETALRRVRKTKRELKYYFIENKLIFIIVGIVLVIAFIVFLINNKTVNYDLNYSEGKTFFYNNLSITINNSIVTDLDYKGNTLDNYFIVAQVTITNDTGNYIDIDLNMFKLLNNKKTYTNTSKYYDYFKDMSTESYITSMPGGTTKNIILVYKLDEYSPSSGYKIRLFNGTVTNKNSIDDKSVYIKLSPSRIDSIKESTDYRFNNVVSLDKTYLYDTTISISSCELKDKYIYEYSKCKNGSCDNYKDLVATSSSSRTLLICKTEFKMSSDTWYSVNSSSLSSFMNDFGYIKSIDSNEILTSAFNVTPSNSPDFIAFEIPNTYDKVGNLELVLSIRDYKYNIYLLN